MDTIYTKEELKALSNSELNALKDKFRARSDTIDLWKKSCQNATRRAEEADYNNKTNLYNLDTELSTRIRSVYSAEASPSCAYDSVHFHPENLESIALRFEIREEKYLDDVKVSEEVKTTGNYVLFHNVLLGVGGGYFPLRSLSPCSDEEWEAMKRGEIPEKFFGGATRNSW